MNSKITLTINSDVVKSARQLSKKKGESLSKIVESYLKKVSKPIRANKKKSSVTELKGILGNAPKDFDYKEERYKYLMEKYK
jgi:LysM repeat protein